MAHFLKTNLFDDDTAKAVCKGCKDLFSHQIFTNRFDWSSSLTPKVAHLLLTNQLDKAKQALEMFLLTYLVLNAVLT